MKIATYNVNGVNGRLNVLLRWLEESAPDIVCLQELKAPHDKFPLKAINDAGYNAIWHGQKQWNGVAILAKNMEIEEVTRTLPGDEDDLQSRYIEAVIDGIVIACLYLPNGNPAPGPKLEYKLKWFERLTERAETLLNLKIPVILVGDFNVMPTELDVYKPERWVNDALFRPDYFRNAYQRDAGLRIDHFLLSPEVEKILISATVDRHVRGWEKTSDHAPVWIEIDRK
jgi:exodeoxyribonuclease-3